MISTAYYHLHDSYCHLLLLPCYFLFLLISISLHLFFDAVRVAFISSMDAIGVFFELPASQWMTWVKSDQTCDHIVRGLKIDARLNIHHWISVLNIGYPVVSEHTHKVVDRVVALGLDCNSEEVVVTFERHFVFL